jgi:hypothetical protein
MNDRTSGFRKAVIYFDNFANVHDPHSPDNVPYFLFGQSPNVKSCDKKPLVRGWPIRTNDSGAGLPEAELHQMRMDCGSWQY